MEVVATIAELRAAVRTARGAGKRIGLVPTMGAFHEGHLSLMRRAREECGFVVVTLFVNPTQFGPNEDLSRYPRDFEGDRARAAETGADLLFSPEAAEVYPEGFSTFVTVERLTEGLCGASRPTHFRGVTTVVAKLFNMAQPDCAYFGQKDYQQLQAIRRLTRDLDFPIEIVPCPIVREPGGLAMSSRNRYLTPEQREAALSLSRGLAAARACFGTGERSADTLAAAARQAMEGAPDVCVEYVEAVDAETLEPVETVERPVVIAVAALVGRTRLIDNTVLTR
jgi:pantoate--beta-alanine ligase